MNRYTTAFRLLDQTDANHDALGFAPTGAAIGSLDLDPSTYRSHQRDAYAISQGYPLASRFVRLIADHVVGSRSPVVETEEDEASEFLVEHFRDWGLSLNTRVRELSVFGEVHLRASIREGRVFWRGIDPFRVEALETDPVDIQRLLGVRVSGRRRRIPSIRIVDGVYIGEVSSIRTNRLTHATRGHSDLLASIDWMQAHEDFLFGSAEAAKLKSDVIEHISVKGGNRDEVEKIRNDWKRDAKSGTSRFTNDVVTVQYLSPQLGTKEIVDQAQMVKKHILSGLGVPEHWLGEGGGVSRATALEIALPTVKMLESRQSEVATWLEKISRFVLDVASRAGIIATYSGPVAIILPEVRVKETRETASVVSSLADAMVKGVSQDWISKERAGEIFAALMERLNL